jgi:hypothetical protein
LLLFCTLSIHKHEFIFKHLCWHSITKILRNGPRAHFPFTPYLRPQPSRAESSPTRSKVLPYAAGAGSHTSCKPTQSRRSQTATRGAYNRPAVTSDPPLLPRPADERVGSHVGGRQPHQVGALLRLPTRPAWRPRPTRHATGAPNASCMQLHRHLRHYRASSTAEPIP